MHRIAKGDGLELCESSKYVTRRKGRSGYFQMKTRRFCSMAGTEEKTGQERIALNTQGLERRARCLSGLKKQNVKEPKNNGVKWSRKL